MYVCVSVRVCVCVCVYPAIRFHISQRIFFKFGENIICVMTRIVGYLYVSAHNARACVHTLIFERIISKCAGDILLLTISVKDYVLFIFTHHAHACARACVIRHLLIYGPSLFKFAVNILQITTSSMGYVLVMFTHRVCVVKTFTHLWTDYRHICWAHTTDDQKLHVIHTYHVPSLRACVRLRACVCERECV
jgi:hypothetical protein